MSQVYSCIITKEQISVPAKLPHFIRERIIYIPLDVEGQMVREFIERFEDGEIRHDLLTSTNPNDEFPYYFDPTPILEIVDLLKLTFKEFAIYHSSDWGVPIEHHEGLFKDGRLMEGTKHIGNEWDTLDTMIGHQGGLFPFFDLNWDTLLTFGDYEIADDEYKSQLNG